MVAAFLMVYFGVRRYRDQVAGGTITFGRALGVGLAITLVASLCYVVMWQIVYYNFMPDFLDHYGAYTLEKERAAGATDRATGSAAAGDGGIQGDVQQSADQRGDHACSSRCRWAC